MFKLARMAGVSTPLTAWLVQADAEIKSKEFQARLERLERSPYSALHPDIPEIGRILYDTLQKTGDSRLQLDDGFMQRYGRPLAMMRKAGYVSGTATLGGGQFYGGIWVTDPGFLLYLAALYEDQDCMERFVERVDTTPTGKWLRGADLASEYALPLPVVRAVFQLYAGRGLGIVSEEIGALAYRTLA